MEWDSIFLSQLAEYRKEGLDPNADKSGRQDDFSDSVKVYGFTGSAGIMRQAKGRTEKAVKTGKQIQRARQGNQAEVQHRQVTN